MVWKSSGTTGVPGIFVQDDDALATCDALIAAQLERRGLAQRFAEGMIARRARRPHRRDRRALRRLASWRRLGSGSPWLAARAFSVLEPLPRLVAELNAYQPAFVASYPTMLALLADEKRARPAEIAPRCLWSGGEYLRRHPDRTSSAPSAARVANEYGASECMSIAFGCREGWLHVNADWVVLEPVDRDYRPTPPGEPSHTVLLTNLANRVQPIIRYDLGDSIVVKPGPCACGSRSAGDPGRRPARRRRVAITAPDGRVVRLLPLALTTVVEEAAGVHRFQIVQTAADRLRCASIAATSGARQAAWRAAPAALRDTSRGSRCRTCGRARRRPPGRSDPRSGKLKEVVVARATAGAHPRGSRGIGAR